MTAPLPQCSFGNRGIAALGLGTEGVLLAAIKLLKLLASDILPNYTISRLGVIQMIGL